MTPFDLPPAYAACAPEVAPATLAAIITVESGGYPWAIGVNGTAPLAHQPADRLDAERQARGLIAQGYAVDLGLMQIASSNLNRLGITLDQVFDPCTNIASAASILIADYGQAIATTPGDPSGALDTALSLYNAGDTHRGFDNGYVQRIHDVAGGQLRDRSQAPPPTPSRHEPATIRQPRSDLAAARQADPGIDGFMPQAPADHPVATLSSAALPPPDTAP